jgi:hypothetical protein
MLIRPLDEQSSEANEWTKSFHRAVQKLASLLGAAEEQINEEGTNISSFKAQYSNVLHRSKSGSVEVITQNSYPYIILAGDQVMALADNADLKVEKTMGELFPDLPCLPGTHERMLPVMTDMVDPLRFR